MSAFKEITDGIRNTAGYKEKSDLTHYLCNILQNLKRRVDAQDSDFLKNFALSEMEKLIAVIPATENYREKDYIFGYEDGLLGVLSLSGTTFASLSAAHASTVRALVETVQKERVLENALDEMFKLKKIEKADIEKVLNIVKPMTDEYRRSMLYQGLHAYGGEFNKLTAEAKGALADFTAEDLTRLLDGADDPDKVKSLEFAADVCKRFADNKVLDVLEKTMALKHDNVRYYAAGTLIGLGREIPAAALNEMAGNLEYAELLYSLLKKHGKSSLFPAEYSSTEYLAKSDLVHWLTYPTELGKQPDEIELLGVAKVKSETFHIFKFKSDSDTLSDDLHGQWLIGWSGDGGGTFSNFELLSDYEKKTEEKTLKNIVKKLLK